jgi:Bardet-Biedl syndrome 2 protein
VNSRLWRVKTKNKVTAIESYDLDMDGVPEVFSGWDNGMFAVRREENGEVVFRQTLEAPVAAILKADYRMDGKEEVMICSEAGEIRAYLASDVDLSTVAGNGLTGKDNAADQKALAELQAQKLELLAEMKLLERSLKMNSTKEVPVGMLPHGTALTYTLEGDLKLGAVALKVEVNTDCQIMNLIAVDLGTLCHSLLHRVLLHQADLKGVLYFLAHVLQREWCW